MHILMTNCFLFAQIHTLWEFFDRLDQVVSAGYIIR